MLQYLDIEEFVCEDGYKLNPFRLSYEVAGPTLGSAPIVLVNHALTGNSSVSGENGWWGSLIGPGESIDTEKYSILAFNILGNGYDGEEFMDALHLTLRDLGRLFLTGLEKLGVTSLHSIIGASMGGSLTLQIAYLAPTLSEHVFAIAADYKASAWLLGQTLVQRRILEHSAYPLEDARIHAMLLYRAPGSINERFAPERLESSGGYDIESWLTYHGDALARRFKLSAYKVMTRLTGCINVCDAPEDLARIKGQLHLISVDSDILFPHARTVDTYERLKSVKKEVDHGVIYSPHGHDAFLIEYDQLSAIVSPFFQ